MNVIRENQTKETIGLDKKALIILLIIWDIEETQGSKQVSRENFLYNPSSIGIQLFSFSRKSFMFNYHRSFPTGKLVF
jgi:hypothetical protein